MVELFIKKISRKYEIKKQVIGEDADLGKSGRILNRVIEWGRDGITIEADQRHVREILKGLELERAQGFWLKACERNGPSVLSVFCNGLKWC